MSVLGTKNHAAKLTEEDVRAIRANPKGRLPRELAVIYGVSETTIRQVLLRYTWIHV